MNPFSINSPVIQFLAKVWDLIVLNILTVILSLPIVTIGAANTALHYAVDKLFAEEGTLLKNYFHSFKINFKQSTLCWLLLLVLSASSLVVLLFMEANAFSGLTGLRLGLTLFNGLVVGILGIPGIGLLLLVQWIFT